MKSEQFWNVDNVAKFQGFDVENGEVSVSDDEYAEHLTEAYGDVEVCGYTFSSGSLFQDADPTAFRCGKNDYESQLQSELEDRLSKEDSDNIEFIDGDESELDDEEDESDDE